jgi:hypothetical protein
MTRTLLILVAVGAVICFLAFGTMHALGGFHIHVDNDDDDGKVASGPTVTRDLAWPGGEALRVNVASRILYTQGPQTKMTVTGPQSVVDDLGFDDDGELVNRKDRHWRFGHDQKLIVSVTSPGTHDFHLSGAQELELKQYDQDSLDLHVSGAAAVSGEGRAKSLDAHLSGAGELDLGKLPVDDAVVRIAGAGDATIDPKVSADVSISGAGHVNLKTKPPTLHTSVVGFGTIDHP